MVRDSLIRATPMSHALSAEVTRLPPALGKLAFSRWQMDAFLIGCWVLIAGAFVAAARFTFRHPPERRGEPPRQHPASSRGDA